MPTNTGSTSGILHEGNPCNRHQVENREQSTFQEVGGWKFEAKETKKAVETGLGIQVVRERAQQH